MRASTVAAAAALLFGSVSAHFTLDYPLSRGFDEDIEPQFCGGFNQTGPRTAFPIANGPILIDSHHNQAQAAVVISFSGSPTSFSNFNTTSNGTNYPYLVPFWSMSSSGEYCVRAANLSTWGLGVQNGTNATIQVVFNGGDGTLYQCADVYIDTSFTASNVSCVNGTQPTSSPTSSGSGLPASATSSAASTSKTAAAVASKSITAGSSLLIVAAVLAVFA